MGAGDGKELHGGHSRGHDTHHQRGGRLPVRDCGDPARICEGAGGELGMGVVSRGVSPWWRTRAEQGGKELRGHRLPFLPRGAMWQGSYGGYEASTPCEGGGRVREPTHPARGRRVAGVVMTHRRTERARVSRAAWCAVGGQPGGRRGGRKKAGTNATHIFREAGTDIGPL